MEEFVWAMSMVQSRCADPPGGAPPPEPRSPRNPPLLPRSFGSMAPEGGLRVRFLCPLVDLINHQGARAVPTIGSQDIDEAGITASWRLAEEASGGEWWMELVAECDVPEGNQELFISYSSSSNDTFFQHYGFVPLGNPVDDVELFPDLADALEWWAARFTGDATDSLRVEAAARAAVEQVETELDGQILEAVQRESGSAAPKVSEVYGKRLRALPGGQVDRRLTAAFAAAFGACGCSTLPPSRAADAAVALRAAEMLSWFSTGALQDLRELVAASASPSDQAYYTRHLQMVRSGLRDLEEDETGTDGLAPLGALTRKAEAAAQRGSSLASGSLDSMGLGSFVDAGVPPGSDLEELLGSLGAYGEPLTVLGGREVAVVDTPSGSLSTDWARQQLLAYQVHKKIILLQILLAIGVRTGELDRL